MLEEDEETLEGKASPAFSERNHFSTLPRYEDEGSGVARTVCGRGKRLGQMKTREKGRKGERRMKVGAEKQLARSFLFPAGRRKRLSSILAPPRALPNHPLIPPRITKVPGTSVSFTTTRYLNSRPLARVLL